MSPASGAGAGGGRRVTIRSISCRGVKAFVPFQKPPLYAAVSLGGHREKTPPDADGGENPEWEGAVVAFDIDGREQQQEEVVQFEVKAQVPLLGHKLVGTASVPLAYLAAGDGAAPQHVSYQVRAPDGKPNGTLTFAYAVTRGGAGGPRPPPQLSSVPPPEQNPTFCSAPPQLNSVPPPEQNPNFCSAPPPPPPVTAYPTPATANFAAHGGGYPPPPQPAPSAPPMSGSLYPPLHDFLPSSTYPPPPSTLPYPATTTNPHFPEPSSTFYQRPLAPDSLYPPPAPGSSSVYPPPAPPAHYVSSYPPQQPPPTTSSYPPTGTYPPPPESCPAYPPALPRSVDRELPYYPAPPSTYPAPPGGSFYPPPDLDGGAPPYYYPPPGSRYP